LTIDNDSIISTDVDELIGFFDEKFGIREDRDTIIENLAEELRATFKR
jgi:hypothetical protein